MKARVEVFYFGCCPYSYFFAYGGGFLDETWTRTGGDFKAELERFGLEVVEYNMLEHPDLVWKLNLQIDPYTPFSSLPDFSSTTKMFQKTNSSKRYERHGREKRMKIDIKGVTPENIDDLVGPRCAPRWDDPRHAQTLKEGGLKKKEVFPLLPKLQKRTVLITCVLVYEKALQNQGIGSKLVQSLVRELRHRPLPCFDDKPAEEIAVGSWGCHTGFPESLPRFRRFWHKNGFKEDTAFPDPSGKGGIHVHTL